MKSNAQYIQRAFGKEPEWSKKEEVDPAEILRAINWYNSNSQRRNYKKWTLTWMEDKKSSWSKQDAAFVRKCPVKSFRTFGHYCRMLSRGFPQVDQLLNVVNENITNLIEQGKNTNTERATPSVSPKERMEQKFAEIAADMMNLCDDALISIREKNDEHKKMNVYRWLEGRNATGWEADMLTTMFAPALEELDRVVNGDDQQLVDAYSFLGKQQQKYLHRFMNNLIEDCMKYHADRKPKRKKRRVNPEKVVSKIKYLKESGEFGIKSIDPKKILTAKQLLVFSCRYNTLSVYYAERGKTLSIKGTTLQDFDTEKSETRTIKNAKKEMGKVRDLKTFESLWSRQTSVVKTANGRLNENCVILKAFE